MDDSNKPYPNINQPNIKFGMSNFGPAQREQFGQNVRLAMACIESSPPPVNTIALPHDEASIRQRLTALSQEITSTHADLLELLVRFDDLQGWKSSGASHCAAWMNLEIGISIQLSWEYLRVGRKLQTLPTLQALFRVGKLSWSKVRLITRVAYNNNEKTLCHAALDASVSDVKRLCEEFRWNDDNDDDANGENARACQQWASRGLTWNEASNGNTRIQLVLPPELAQVFLNSVEQSLNQLDSASDSTVSAYNTSNTANPTDTTLTQSRADAAVLMAESSLQNAGKAIASADRYQVSVSIDASELATSKTTGLSKRPTLNGVGPIARETAKRIACDCSLAINSTENGEPINIGRKSRIWPSAMARVIKERDQHCAWPGCTHSRHLHIHHIKHWADGGETSVPNGVCLCAYHHTLVHEGGYTIEHVEANTQRLQEQFVQQQRNDDINQFDFEKSLRNNRASFNTVRKLSPTRYRYRILNADGIVITGRSSNNAELATQDGASQAANCFQASDSPNAEAAESTRVYYNDATSARSDQRFTQRCREAIPQCYIRKKAHNYAQGYATGLN